MPDTDVLTPVLTDDWDAERSWTLATYESRGGYRALVAAGRHDRVEGRGEAGAALLGDDLGQGAGLGGQPAESGTQFVVARSPCRGDRATDAARGIRHPCHPCLDLVGPVAAEHEVRMAVDEPRHDGAPPGIHDAHLAARHRLCA